MFLIVWTARFIAARMALLILNGPLASLILLTIPPMKKFGEEVDRLDLFTSGRLIEAHTGLLCKPIHQQLGRMYTASTLLVQSNYELWNIEDQ